MWWNEEGMRKCGGSEEIISYLQQARTGTRAASGRQKCPRARRELLRSASEGKNKVNPTELGRNATTIPMRIDCSISRLRQPHSSP